jgi:hypothetical protein
MHAHARQNVPHAAAPALKGHRALYDVSAAASENFAQILDGGNRRGRADISIN